MADINDDNTITAAYFGECIFAATTYVDDGPAIQKIQDGIDAALKDSDTFIAFWESLTDADKKVLGPTERAAFQNIHDCLKNYKDHIYDPNDKTIAETGYRLYPNQLHDIFQIFMNTGDITKTVTVDAGEQGNDYKCTFYCQHNGINLTQIISDLNVKKQPHSFWI